jgi:hypothetical protein
LSIDTWRCVLTSLSRIFRSDSEILTNSVGETDTFSYGYYGCARLRMGWVILEPRDCLGFMNNEEFVDLLAVELSEEWKPGWFPGFLAD